MFKIKFLVVSIFFSSVLLGGKIDKAYEALSVYDYFQAKSLFEELLRKEPIAAPYGLSIIHFRKDNPFHNLDKAYAFISKAESAYKNARTSEKEDVLKFYIDSVQISKHKEKITLALWEKIYVTKNISKINSFIKQFESYSGIDSLKLVRNDIAFEKAKKVGTVQSYREFYTSYPNDPRAQKAKYDYEKMLYETKTKAQSLQSYVDFVHIYPDNQFVDEAYDKIFEIATAAKSLESYKWFVDRFPKNPNTEESWKKIFALSFTDFSDAEIIDFHRNNKEFPFPKMISEARVLRDLDLHKISVSRKWGYINSLGEVEIMPRYEFENDFSNGLALVANEDFVGYINKKGEQVIDFLYDDGSDFIEGVAHVLRGNSYALIDKLGNTILDFAYSYISDSKDGIIVAKSDDDRKFRFYKNNGKELFDAVSYDYASQFEGGYAIVGQNGMFGLITKTGEFHLPLKFKRIIRHEHDRLTLVNAKGKFGVVNLIEKDTVIDFKYDYIGRRSEGKYAVFGTEKYGYLDSVGDVVVSQRLFRYPGDTIRSEFKGEYAITSYRNKFGILDSDGQRFFPNIFDDVTDEVVPYPIPCAKRGKWGYISKQITMWEPYKYDYAGAFKDGVAIVSLEGKYGVINNRHKTVIGFKYDFISEFNDEYYLAKKDNFFGLITKEGEYILLPFYYSKIEYYKGDVLRLYLFGEYQYFNLKTQTFIYGMMPEKKE